MQKNLYTILLDNTIIGTTELEKADAPMGVVFGQINFIDTTFGYDFFKKYCLTNRIQITYDYPDDKVITTAYISNLKVLDQNGIEIKGAGVNIEGMDSDIFTITILGVSYPFFEDEIPHHVKAYNDQFNNN